MRNKFNHKECDGCSVDKQTEGGRYKALVCGVTRLANQLIAQGKYAVHQDAHKSNGHSKLHCFVQNKSLYYILLNSTESHTFMNSKILLAKDLNILVLDIS